MGSKSNVNPDHYKERGREPPGRDVVHEVHKQKYTQAKKTTGGSEYIPADKTVNERPAKENTRGVGQVNESGDSSGNK